MNSKFFFLILILSFALGLNAQETKVSAQSFPINFNGEMFSELSNLNGKIIAYDGTINQIEKSKNKTPFYKLDLDNNSSIWTVLMFHNKESQIGDRIRVVGYVSEANKANKKEKKYLGDSEFIVIAFGLVDFNKQLFLFLGGAEAQKQEWIDGKIPSTK